MFRKVGIFAQLEAWFFEQLATRWLPYPKTVIIEPINICQLRCPLCPTGLQKLDASPAAMSLETFKTILSKLSFVRAIDLHRAGEPFLNPDLLSMIRYASTRKIYVVISSNFSFAKPNDFFDELVASGLERLIISLDGASEETYAKYRIAGDFELVMGNMKKLSAAKAQARSKTPEVVWQYLVNRFNEHEIDAAREMAKELKVILDLRPLDMSDNLVDVELDTTIEQRKAQWLGINRQYVCEQYLEDVRYPIFQGICSELFTSLAVTAEGKVLPCCGTWSRHSVFGDLLQQSFRDIWFSPQYVNSRLRFFRENFQPETRNVCFQCRNFGTAPTRKDKVALLKTIVRKNFRHLERKLSRPL